ncbi:MAG: hypothetical protein EOP53_13380 [Sphingobacteriales bacterium]|nr:MAG: hypothetical protein EOP53_13380 [Sphingobacteriales bacterium]
MNIQVKLKTYELQNTGKNLQNIKQNLDALDLDEISIGFYSFVLDDLCVKLLSKSFTIKKKEFNFIISPAGIYVIYTLWLLMPKTVYADLHIMRKIIAEIDKNGIRYANIFNSNF